jgi:hypothetical protein
MDKIEAKSVLNEELETYRSKSYDELVQLMGSPINYGRKGASDASYQIEIQVFWDGRANGNVRVIGSVDDGGWRAFLPLTESFIMGPGGEFIGE